MESAIARARGSAGLPRTTRLGVTQAVQRAPAPAEPQPMRPPVFQRPTPPGPTVQRDRSELEMLREPLDPEPEPAPQTRPRSNAITERPPVMEPPPFTRPRSNAVSGPAPDLGLGSSEPETPAPQGWQRAERPTAPRTEPLPLRIGQQRGDIDLETEDTEVVSQGGRGREPEKDDAEKEKAPPIDLLQLARDILPHVKRLMLVERERRPRG
jgi:hypothetical protein